MFRQLACRFLPWHELTWTGRMSVTGQVREAACSCGERYAVYLAVGPLQWATMPAIEFEASTGKDCWPTSPEGGR